MSNTNEERTTFTFSINENNSTTESQKPKECLDRKGFVKYGELNTYPDYLYQLYLTSPTHHTIIDGENEWTYGNGIIVNPEIGGDGAIINNKGEKIEALIKKIVSDYVLFGGFNVQKIVSDGETKKQYLYLDSKNIRYDEEIENVYYATNWDKYQVKFLKHPVYDGKKKDSVYVFRGTKTRSVYPVPTYGAAIKSIETEAEIQNYNLNNIKNAFQVNKIIAFNDGIPSKEKIDEINEGIKKTFTGTNNANGILTTFNKSKENSVEVISLEADKTDEKFQTLDKNVRGSIFIAHRVTSPNLYGDRDETKGFNRTEYQEAFDIYNSTTINTIQTILEEQFDILFGVENSIRFKKYVNNGSIPTI